MREVAAVAVAEEHRRPGVRLRHVPAVKPRAVRRLKPGVFERESAGIPIASRISYGEVDQRVFEEHGGHHDHEIREQGNTAEPPEQRPKTPRPRLAGARRGRHCLSIITRHQRNL